MSESDAKRIMREQAIESLAPHAEPHELAYVLSCLDAVPDQEDLHAYIAAASEVLRVAVETALRPRIERLRAEVAASEAKIAVLEEQQRVSLVFDALKFANTIH
jgi:hypothetical protein